jgi:hypothetical protein
MIARQLRADASVAHERDHPRRPEPANIERSRGRSSRSRPGSRQGVVGGEVSPDLYRTLARNGEEAGRGIISTAAMSPEQARALPVVDKRTDIWAFGCVLYECCRARVNVAGSLQSRTRSQGFSSASRAWRSALPPLLQRRSTAAAPMPDEDPKSSCGISKRRPDRDDAMTRCRPRNAGDTARARSPATLLGVAGFLARRSCRVGGLRPALAVRTRCPAPPSRVTTWEAPKSTPEIATTAGSWPSSPTARPVDVWVSPAPETCQPDATRPMATPEPPAEPGLQWRRVEIWFSPAAIRGREGSRSADRWAAAAVPGWTVHSRLVAEQRPARVHRRTTPAILFRRPHGRGRSSRRPELTGAGGRAYPQSSGHRTVNGSTPCTGRDRPEG